MEELAQRRGGRRGEGKKQFFSARSGPLREKVPIPGFVGGQSGRGGLKIKSAGGPVAARNDHEPQTGLPNDSTGLGGFLGDAAARRAKKTKICVMGDPFRIKFYFPCDRLNSRMTSSTTS